MISLRAWQLNFSGYTCPKEEFDKPQRDEFDAEDRTVPVVGPVHQAEEFVYPLVLL